MNFLRIIKKNCLFQGFRDKDINTLFDCMDGKIVKKSKGMLVAYEDSEIEELCIVLEGKLLQFVTKLNGKRQPLGLVCQGEMFGLYQGYLKPNKLGYYVVAASDVTLLFLKISTIVTMCENACACHQKIISRALEYLSKRVYELQNNKDYMAIKGMRHKISRLIYDKYIEQQTTSIALGMNRNEMAEYLNVSRPSMSRELMRMREENILDFYKDKITIINIKRIEDILKGAV
ncbi:MAG: Crp/Fnr family transcriptional regulator [Bacillota bacterium]